MKLQGMGTKGIYMNAYVFTYTPYTHIFAFIHRMERSFVLPNRILKKVLSPADTDAFGLVSIYSSFILNIITIIVIIIVIIIICCCCFRSDTRRLQRIRGGDKVIRGAHDFVYICM